MDILEILKDCRTIAVGGHQNPDGDCAGSCMAIAIYLEKKIPGANVDVYLEELPPELARSIPRSETVLHALREGVRYDAFVVLDTDRSRLGFSAEAYRDAGITVNIDHHFTNPGSAAYNHVDPNASSASELIAEMIGEEDMDAEIARALYIGIITDTGMFLYPSTSEKTMRIAGSLMNHGFDFSGIAKDVFFRRTWMQTRMRGIAFTKAESFLDGRYVVCVMDRELLDRYGADRDDLDNISSQLLLTEGVDCVNFAHETKPGVWRLSLRSDKITDVSRIAAVFGGGGHVRAAGCTVYGAIGPALTRIMAEVAEQLEESRNRDAQDV